MIKKLSIIVFILFLLGIFVFIFIEKKENTQNNEIQKNEINKTETNKSINTIKEKNESKKLTKGLFADYEKNLEDEVYMNFETNHSSNIQEDKIRQKTQELKIPDINFSITKKEFYRPDINLTSNLEKKESKKLIKKEHSNAKLAIIIDDMSSKEQVKALKNTGLKLIPSFFPSSKNHPYTKEYAKEFDFFMVHLPLAALKFKNEEIQTLKPNHTQEFINNKIAQIKNDFKNLKFVNNHTGSLFTSDKEAMIKLFKAFDNFELIFVDSLTTGASKARILVKDFNQTYIRRDIFLDNKDEIFYIKKQIAKAVNLAKKNGFAIAIGHPRKNTFKALIQSKNLLDEVELVYLSEIYGYN